MKKILGLIASPRKLGNCEIMVKEISSQIDQPHELRLLRLHDFDIRPCRACYQCMVKTKKCIINDDMHKVLDAILEADALILAAPTYFLGANAILKLFLDRGLSFYTHNKKLWEKPAVGVGIAGINGYEGYTLLGIKSFFSLILADIKQCDIIYGALPGEVFLNEANKNKAAELAANLFGQPVKSSTVVCPLCDGDTFRFLGGNKVQCMLCSNYGTLSGSVESPVFEVDKGEHQLFLTTEDALEHRKWLVGMKERFLANKDKLKKITVSYREQGDWIRP